MTKYSSGTGFDRAVAICWTNSRTNHWFNSKCGTYSPLNTIARNEQDRQANMGILLDNKQTKPLLKLPLLKQLKWPYIRICRTEVWAVWCWKTRLRTNKFHWLPSFWTSSVWVWEKMTKGKQKLPQGAQFPCLASYLSLFWSDFHSQTVQNHYWGFIGLFLGCVFLNM